MACPVPGKGLFFYRSKNHLVSHGVFITMVLSIIYTRIHLQAGSRLWCGYGSGMIRHRSRKQEHTKPEPYAMRDSSYIWCKLGSPSILIRRQGYVNFIIRVLVYLSYMLTSILTAVKGCVSVIAYCFHGLPFVIYQLYLCIIFFFLLSIVLPLIEPIYFYRRKWLKYNSFNCTRFIFTPSRSKKVCSKQSD